MWQDLPTNFPWFGMLCLPLRSLDSDESGAGLQNTQDLGKCVLSAFSHVQSTRVMNCLRALCPPWLPAPALNSASLSISGWPSCHMSVTFQAGYHMCRPWPPTLSCRVLCCSKGTVGPDGSHFSSIFSWSHISERKKKKASEESSYLKYLYSLRFFFFFKFH